MNVRRKKLNHLIFYLTIIWENLISKSECLIHKYVSQSQLLKKEAAGKEVIIEFVLMVVAVAVGYIFREELKNLVTGLGSSVSSKITTMFNEALLKIFVIKSEELRVGKGWRV